MYGTIHDFPFTHPVHDFPRLLAALVVYFFFA